MLHAVEPLLLPDRRSRAIALVGPPAPPRKEEPVLAAVELTPTSALFSSTRSRRVSVPSRHRQRLPWRHAPLARGTPERPGPL